MAAPPTRGSMLRDRTGFQSGSRRLWRFLLPASLALLLASPMWLSTPSAAQTPSLTTEEANLTADDGVASDSLGQSLALSGDSAVAGASGADVGGNSNQGAAYVFVRDGGSWTPQPQTKLTAGDGAAHDGFGGSVAIDGDTALVTSAGADVDGNNDQGAAYVFVRSAGTWTQQAKLTADDGASSDFFGQSVSLSGDTAVVAAQWDDVGANSNQGSAYVFARSGTSWSQQAKLTADDGAAGDFFGASVAIDGDTAVVGAYQATVGGILAKGAAYVFVRSGDVWNPQPQAKLTASDGALGDHLGISVTISGDTALVGALQDDVGANTDQGSAYVFVRSGSTWSPQAKLTASDGAASDFFGRSVALSGDKVVVGVDGVDLGGNSGQGAAYVFERSGSTWSPQTKLIASDGAASDFLGRSVAFSGDSAVAGAPGESLSAIDRGPPTFSSSLDPRCLLSSSPASPAAC